MAAIQPIQPYLTSIPPSHMLGTFQQSQLRIEIGATAPQLTDALTHTASLRLWLLPQILVGNLPQKLSSGLIFTSWTGFVPVEHTVEALEENGLRLRLSRGIDGIHEWQWGEGWVQSCLEGVSYLPLQTGNTAALLRLKTYIALTQKCRS
jgi:hypothetical protein